jgi:hypothetical protein
VPSDPYRGTVTFADLQAEVLSNDFNADQYGPRVKRWINEAVERIARRSGLPEYERVQDINTVAGAPTLSLPTDDIRILSIRNTTDRQDLTCVDIQRIDEAS